PVVAPVGRARGGEPEARPLLAEAWSLATPTNELPRVATAAAAVAEAAWLEGDTAAVAVATADGLLLAPGKRSPWLVGLLTLWRRRAGVDQPPPGKIAEP